MNKYEEYKQELIRDVLNHKIDALGLVDYIIELCEKIDYLDEKLNNKKELGDK